ncbi:MAG: tetratricopeptide repeat protein [Anaerolineaceae bacterium]|nr:tetratricopeptide repeat protein [Anaerolineaceae bacterium]
MHNLVPQFILEQLAQENHRGSFAAVSLFIDISGFTQLMETQMQHGQHGAEVMASVMLGIFEPLVQFVFEQGGFVGNFAGDAFTAFFPILTAAAQPTIAQQAVTAAWQAQQHLTDNPTSYTPYGDFQMTAKIGLALGDASWAILSDSSQERAAFYFRGTAVEQCALAEKQAQPGEILLTTSLAQTLGSWVNSLPRHEFWVLNGRPARHTAPQPFTLPQSNLPLLGRFFPKTLITQPLQGEFRQIVNVFISLPHLQDEAELAPFMQTVFALQAQFGSVTSRLDFGDKGCTLLLFWGAPIAHETDIERALSFVLALRQQSQTTIRAGLTYRVAHAGFIGSTLHQEFTCYGSGVNLAARFMTSAPPGEIWVDAPIFHRVRQQFALEFVGNRPFKGFAGEQPVYRLVGRQETAAPIFSGQMLGRETELAQLAEFIRPLANGRLAGAMRLEGEAGIGKSRLVHAFLDNLSANFGPHQVFLCQTDQILRQSLNPLRYWLARYFGQSAQQSEIDNKAAFTNRLEQLLSATQAPELARELNRTRTFLGALVDLHWTDSLYEQLEPQGRFENTLTALTTLLQAESLRQPVLLVIEDVHWLDDDSRQFLQQLWLSVTAVPNTHYPLAIIATSRPEQQPEGKAGTLPWQSITLGQLSATSLNQLAADLLDGPISPRLLKLLTERGEGNPFFTEQIVRYLQEQALLVESEEGWSVTAVQQTVLPRDVHALLVARLDRLTARVKNGVQHAAVLGREFEVRLLALMLRDEEQLDSILNEAEQAAIWAALSELRYLFRHALVRDAAYKMQLRARRQALHKLAVEALETLYASDLAPHFGELAYHAEQANLTGKARRYLHQAGDAAREAYQNNEALDYYGRALTLTPPEDNQTRYELLLAQEKIYHWQGKRTKQETLLKTLIELTNHTKDKEKQVEVLLLQARFAEEIGDYPAEITAAQKSLQLAKTINHEKFIADSLAFWGTALHWQGSSTEAKDQINQALEIYRKIGEREMEADALFDLGAIALKQGDYVTSSQLKQQVLHMAQSLNNRHKEAFTRNSLGLLAGHQHDYGLAQMQLSLSLSIYEEIGHRRGIGVVLNNLGTIAHMLGNYEQAQHFYQRSLTIRRETGERQGEAIILNNLGEVFAKQQQFATARSFYEQCLHLEKELGLRFAQAATLYVYAETLIALNKLTLAKENMQAALRLRFELNQATHHLLPPQLGLAYIAHLNGTHDKAQAGLELVMAELSAQTMDGLGDPFGFYWLCYTLLDYYKDPRAAQLIADAHQKLQVQANNIPDLESRDSFLQNVPENRLIGETYRQINPET